ncbi:MAG: serine/threonine-protein kinase [Saccharospirillum sp.]
MPDASSKRRSGRVRCLLAMVMGLLAMLWVSNPTAFEQWLNARWIAATTGWHWSSRDDAPAYHLDPTLPAGVIARLSLGDGQRLDISTLYGQGHFGTTGLAAPINERLVGSWFWLQPESPVIPADSARVAYWRPAHHGAKQLAYVNQETLYWDGALLAWAKGESVRMRPWFGLVVGDQPMSTDWRGGVRVLTSLLPEPQRHAPVDDPSQLPRLAVDHPLARQWLLEYEALQRGLVVATPVSLAGLAALAMLVPWALLPWFRRHGGLVWVLMVIWLTAHFLLILLYQWWLPLWPVLVSLGFAATTALIGRRILSDQEALLTDYRALAKDRLQQLLHLGQLEAAQKLLLTSQWLSNDVDGVYQVAQAFERKRQYQAALDCYQWIVRQAPAFKDVAERQQALKALSDPKAALRLDETQRTVMAPRGLEQPEIGRYRLLGELGRGAMGTVYKAVDPRIERSIALKVVNLDTLPTETVEAVKQRFYREARAAGKLNHPNIVTVYDVGEEQDLAYIAMDLIEGISLQQRLGQPPAVEVAEICRWLAQAADALAYAHANGIIHRDIKPANLLLDTHSGRLKVSDFGVARMAGSEQTGTGIVLGSPTYMSPEQIRGEVLTAQTDIYSLGVTLYRALTGQLPFQGDTLPSLAYAILHDQARSPGQFNPDVSPALVRIVNRAMQKNPADRYATAGDMAQALRRRLGSG